MILHLISQWPWGARANVAHVGDSTSDVDRTSDCAACTKLLLSCSEASYLHMATYTCRVTNYRTKTHHPVSLEDSSFSFILTNFELFPPEHVSLLPTRIRSKLLSHLPVADVCKLEETAAVEGIDMNTQVWKQAITSLYGNQLDELWKQPVTSLDECPSTIEELQQGQGYRQLYIEVVFRVILHRYSCFHSNRKQLLCMLLCCCGPPGSLFSSEIQHGIVPPRYSTAARSKDDLVQLALSCFGSPTRLSLFTGQYIVAEYLTDQSVVANLRELCITLWRDCVRFGFDLNKLFSSSNRLVSLHIDFSELYREYVKQINIKSLPSSLRKIHIYPGDNSLEPLLPLAYFFAQQPDIQLTIIQASSLSVAPFIDLMFHPTQLCGSWSYTSGQQSIILKDVCVPESILKRYNFTQLGRKRQWEEMDDWSCKNNKACLMLCSFLKVCGFFFGKEIYPAC